MFKQGTNSIITKMKLFFLSATWKVNFIEINNAQDNFAC